MKLINTSIGTRLSIGFSVILILIGMLGVFAYQKSLSLWTLTDEIYNHPLKITNTTHEIITEVNNIQLSLKSIALDQALSRRELQQNIEKIQKREITIFTYFASLNNEYLGKRSDIDSAFSTFKNWKQLRDKIIDFRMDGDLASSSQLYKTENVQYREKLFQQIQLLIDSATKTASNFYGKAKHEEDNFIQMLQISMVVIFVITALISYILFKGIRSPLLALTRVTERYRQGNYDARSKYFSNNEIGKLSSAFNNMASTVQQEMSVKEQAAAMAQVLLKENELQPFCKELLSMLHVQLNVQITAIYFLNETKTHFNHYESIGLHTSNIRSFAVNNPEGEFGAVLIQKKIVRITQIPVDTVFSFPIVTGKLKPREIITIPVIQNNTIIAIISLASIYEFSSTTIQLLHEIQPIITARLHGVLAYQKITDISRKLDQQNQELEEKSRELFMQSKELQEFNVELKMQKKNLDEAIQFKSSFLSNMSHELRTPLNSVIALSSVLTRKLKNIIQPEEFNYLGIIEKNGKQLLELINSILDLSRAESGKEDIIISGFSIYSVVNSIIESLEPLAAEKNITIVNTINPNFPEISSDSAKCFHILQNIISNAVKFTDVGKVEISAKGVNSEIHVSIEDTGIGIQNEFIPLIFDEFRQVDEKATRKYGGTGLGLAIAKKYCTLLHGTIDVKSDLGKGSIFTVKIPITLTLKTEEIIKPETVTEVPKNSFTTPQIPKPGSPKTILLVEDSEPQILQMSYILKKIGYNVKIARNGKEALNSIQVSIPDAMILDLMMPEVDGFKVLDSIRSKEDTCKLPVLILTAKHITKNELFFLQGNNIHQIIMKGVLNKADLLMHVHNMLYPASIDVENLSVKPKAVRFSVLVIEDTPDNLETVKALLSEKYDINGTTDYEIGYHEAIKLSPDLILLNISLSGDEGLSAFNKIRSNEKLQKTPVVALTARAMKGDREELLALGFDGYISKPIDSETMEQTFKILLNG